MTDELRILILEDVPTDAELMERELRKAGLSFQTQRVDTRAAFEQALEAFKPDIVLSDYNLPAFTGREALQIVRSTHPEIPFIIVSGTLGDEASVELVHHGARDYVLKNNLLRLGPAVERALATEEGIRARKAAERAQRAAEAKYRALFAEARDGIVLMDADSGRIVDCNPEFERMCGRAFAQLRDMCIWELRPPDKQAAAQQLFGNIRETGQGGSSDFEFQRPDGTLVEIDFLSKCIQINERPCIQSIVRDITERKRSEEMLHASRDLLSSIVENLPIRVFWKDAELRYLGCNTLFARDAGLSHPDELLGKDDFQMGWRGQAELYRADDKRVMTSDTPKLGFEEPQTTPDGSTLWLRTSKVPLHDADGKVFGIVGIYDDITERKQAELALQRALRAQRTLSACNGILVHAINEEQILADMCHAVINEGGYRLAWIGFAQKDESKSVRPVVSAGHDEGYTEALDISWADNERGQGPTGRAVRLGTPQIEANIPSDPQYALWREQALQHGYAASIALPLKNVDGEVFGVLNIYAAEPDAFDEPEVQLLLELAEDLAFGILALRTRQERNHYQTEHLKSIERLKESLTDTIRAIALTVEKRDPYTAGHQGRVANLAAAIAGEIGLDAERIEGLQLGGLIHDIGKIYIPAEILNRPGRLTSIEFEMIKSHPDVGYDIIKDVKFPWPVAGMILQHHERMDGSGYPKGLKGDEIILEARILAVADVVEAMAAHRPYRPAIGIDAGLAEIEAKRGVAFDAEVVDACLRLFREKGFQFD